MINITIMRKKHTFTKIVYNDLQEENKISLQCR